MATLHFTVMLRSMWFDVLKLDLRLPSCDLEHAMVICILGNKLFGKLWTIIGLDAFYLYAHRLKVLNYPD